MDFIEENTEDVFRTKGFHELSEEALALLLQSDKLMMDEVEILAAVREWATVNSVRFGLLVNLYLTMLSSQRVDTHCGQRSQPVFCI